MHQDKKKFPYPHGRRKVENARPFSLASRMGETSGGDFYLQMKLTKLGSAAAAKLHFSPG